MTSTGSRLDRISVDPEIVHGKPVIRGTRVTVQVSSNCSPRARPSTSFCRNTTN
ncbi:DUF433 domain-containing protein [Nakamurella multipartita]|uniref:DUF433 domain-containing protein n=1 Tax=Nakamurella multipartita TaxID=53461 RepID=UPI0038992DB2